MSGAGNRARTSLLKLDAIREDACVATRAGTFECERQLVGRIGNHLPEHLHVSEEQHSIRSPVVENVWKDIVVHELAGQLSGAKSAPLAVGVAKSNRRLPRVDADAEHVELEPHVDVAILSWGGGLHARRSVFDAPPLQVRLSPPNSSWNAGSFDGRLTSEPVLIVRLEVVSEIALCEPVDLDHGKGVLLRRLAALCIGVTDGHCECQAHA